MPNLEEIKPQVGVEVPNMVAPPDFGGLLDGIKSLEVRAPTIKENYDLMVKKFKLDLEMTTMARMAPAAANDQSSVDWLIDSALNADGEKIGGYNSWGDDFIADSQRLMEGLPEGAIPAAEVASAEVRNDQYQEAQKHANTINTRMRTQIVDSIVELAINRGDWITAHETYEQAGNEGLKTAQEIRTGHQEIEIARDNKAISAATDAIVIMNVINNTKLMNDSLDEQRVELEAKGYNEDQIALAVRANWKEFEVWKAKKGELLKAAMDGIKGLSEYTGEYLDENGDIYLDEYAQMGLDENGYRTAFENKFNDWEQKFKTNESAFDERSKELSSRYTQSIREFTYAFADGKTVDSVEVKKLYDNIVENVMNNDMRSDEGDYLLNMLEGLWRPGVETGKIDDQAMNEASVQADKLYWSTIVGSGDYDSWVEDLLSLPIYNQKGERTAVPHTIFSEYFDKFKFLTVRKEANEAYQSAVIEAGDDVNARLLLKNILEGYMSSWGTTLEASELAGKITSDFLSGLEAIKLQSGGRTPLLGTGRYQITTNSERNLMRMEINDFHVGDYSDAKKVVDGVSAPYAYSLQLNENGIPVDAPSLFEAYADTPDGKTYAYAMQPFLQKATMYVEKNTGQTIYMNPLQATPTTITLEGEEVEAMLVAPMALNHNGNNAYLSPLDEYMSTEFKDNIPVYIQRYNPSTKQIEYHSVITTDRSGGIYRISKSLTDGWTFPNTEILALSEDVGGPGTPPPGTNQWTDNLMIDKLWKWTPTDPTVAQSQSDQAERQRLIDAGLPADAAETRDVSGDYPHTFDYTQFLSEEEGWRFAQPRGTLRDALKGYMSVNESTLRDNDEIRKIEMANPGKKLVGYAYRDSDGVIRNKDKIGEFFLEDAPAGYDPELNYVEQQRGRR